MGRQPSPTIPTRPHRRSPPNLLTIIDYPTDKSYLNSVFWGPIEGHRYSSAVLLALGRTGARAWSIKAGPWYLSLSMYPSGGHFALVVAYAVIISGNN